MFQCIAIDSEYCSMGRWISVIAGKKLNLKLYEAYDLCKEANIDLQEYKKYESEMIQKSIAEVQADPIFQNYQKAFTEVVYRLADDGNCIIHDKAATYLLKDRPEVLKVMIYNANVKNKIPRCRMDKSYPNENLTDQEAIDFIRNEDKKRSYYYEACTNEVWAKKENYNIMIDSDVLSREKCAEILIETCLDVRISSEEAAKVIQESIRWSKGMDIKDLG